MKKILLIVDPGIDDSFAIMYALLSPKIDIVGIVCQFGNVSREDALRNSSFLLNLARREDIPLINGASAPLSGLPPEHYYDIHGTHGMGELNIKNTMFKNIYPFHKIYDLITKYGKDLTIVSLSPLTSLALTYLHAGSNIRDVKEIFVMGGAFLVPGNASHLAEANIYGDPHAAKIVTTHGEGITFVPLNVSHRSIVSKEMIHYLSLQTDAPFSPILKPLMDYYSEQYQLSMPGINGAPLHDVTLLSILTNEDHYTTVNRQIFVDTDDLTKGLTHADFRPVPEMVDDHPINKIVLDINVEHLLNDFMKVMNSSS
ncbi:nucleoside hydrolase [Halobacillus seohaensis]|uniref:Nucleoside hydrolase n=1 Tax=Halobacillus seohaensis TaxID=447421 RepID=A0ABW2EJY3_9BACI